MKRTIAILLCLMLLLTACGTGTSLESRPAGDGNKPEDTTAAGQGKPANPTEGGNTEMKTIYVVLTNTLIQRIGAEETVEMETINEYDDAGCLVSSTRKQGGESFTFTAENDEYGRVLRTVCEYGGSLMTMDYTYDDDGNLLSKTTMQDGVVFQTECNTYDEQGNLLTREMTYSQTETNRMVYHYEQGKLVKEERYNNGKLSEYELYFYDESGNVTSRETRLENDALWATSQYSYSEDGLTTYVDCQKYRLQTVTVKDAAGNVIRTESIDVGGATVHEYTYLAIQIPADTPRKNG